MVNDSYMPSRRRSSRGIEYRQSGKESCDWSRIDERESTYEDDHWKGNYEHRWIGCSGGSKQEEDPCNDRYNLDDCSAYPTIFS